MFDQKLHKLLQYREVHIAKSIAMRFDQNKLQN